MTKFFALVLSGFVLSSCEPGTDSSLAEAGAEAAKVTDGNKGPSEAQQPIPMDAVLVMQGGASYTNTLSVQLSLASTQLAREMYITADPSCLSGGRWEDYASTKAWPLAAANSLNAVYVQLRRADGAVSGCVGGSIMHDDVPPLPPVLSINSGAAATASGAVQVRIATHEAAQVYLSSSPGCREGGSWEPWQETRRWSLTNAAGELLTSRQETQAQVHAKIKDHAGNESSCTSAAILYDRQPPSNARLQVNGGAAATASSDVILSLSAQGANDVLIANDAACQAGLWEPYTEKRAWRLTASNTYAYVSAKFRDLAGNESACIAAGIRHDQLPPTNARLSINQGEAYTAQAQVQLTLDAEQASSMYLTHTPGCRDGGSWQAFTPSLAWTLAQTNSRTQVYGKFRDELGNETACLTAEITHDDQAPVVSSIAINDAAALTSAPIVKLSATTHGASQMYLTNTAGCAVGGSWEAFAATTTWTLAQANSTATVYLKFRDEAGNETSCLSASIVHDDLAPTMASLQINGGSLYTKTTAVSLSLIAYDASAVYLTSVAGCTAGGQWEAFANSKPWALTAMNQLVQVYAKFKDAAGNETSCLSAAITHDNIAPAAPTLVINSGDTYTRLSTVNVALSAAGAQRMYLSTDASCASGGSWEDFSSPASVQLATSNATAYVYAKVADLADNESACAQAQIIHDDQPPTANLITLATGESDSNTLSVNLGLAASGATAMYLTTTPGCNAGGSWEAYAAVKAWTLSQSNASNYIYSKYRDAAGNESNCYVAEIRHDDIPPSAASLSLPPEGACAQVASLDLGLHANGATGMYVTNTPGCTSGGSWEPYSSGKTAWALDRSTGPLGVYVKFRDAAGNASACVCETPDDPGALDIAGVSLGSQATTGFIMETEVTWQAPSMGMIPEDPFTPLWHYKGSSYYVWIDSDLRPQVTKVTGATVVTAPLDADSDYKAQDDGHHRFSLGIDKNGYLHITGDMHNYTVETTGVITPYPLRYQRQTILYWKSKQPESVSAGFDFVGGKDAATAIPGTGWITGRFFNDNYGELFYSSQIHAIRPQHLPGFFGLGLYRYHAGTGRWSAIGEEPENIRSGSYYKTFYWENAGIASLTWFQNYQGAFSFDSTNRLHFAMPVNTDTSYNGADRIVYAMSNDGGVTWQKANGTPIPGLPLRGRDGTTNQADIVTEVQAAPFFDAKVSVVADRHGTPGVSVGGVWRTWDGTAWGTSNAQNFGAFPAGRYGYRRPDGSLLMSSPSASHLLGTDSFTTPSWGFEYLGYADIVSIAETELRSSGVIYGIGLKTNPASQAILKTSLKSAPLPCGWGFSDIATSAMPYAGMSGYDAGRFIMTGYGAGIGGGTTDSFSYTYRKLNGDGTILARVDTTIPASAGHSRAGVMMRESLSPGSRQVSMLLAPGTDSGQGAIFQSRSTTAGAATQTSLAGISGPYWVRLVRSGDEFIGSISSNGTTWTERGRVTIPMASNIYLGLASASYTHLYFMQRATFDHVSLPTPADNPVCN